MTKKKTPAKRNPQDTTLRNVQAANRRLTLHAAAIEGLAQRVTDLEALVQKILAVKTDNVPIGEQVTTS